MRSPSIHTLWRFVTKGACDVMRIAALAVRLALTATLGVVRTVGWCFKWAFIVALGAALLSCAGSDDPFPVADTTAVAEPTAAPTATPLPTPEPTATPQPTPIPEPTPDPTFAEAEDIALSYFLELLTVGDDARFADVGEANRLEAEGSPISGFAFRFTASLLRSNHYFPSADMRWEVIGSEAVGDDLNVIDVYICLQTGGLWRDFETDEITRTSVTEPGRVVYQVRRASEQESFKMWSVVEDDGEGNVVSCEFEGEQV